MNWRAAFLRAWVLVSVIWVIGWSVVVLPGAEKKLRIARMSDAELMSQIDECQLPPGVPPPPGNFVLDECLKRLNLARGSFELAFLFIPPFCLLLLGATLGWVFGSFKNIKPRASG
jgi:hypothetical protein